ILCPDDLVSSLNDRRTVGSEIAGDFSTELIALRKASPPNPLQHHSCTSTLRRRKQSRAEEGKCAKSKVFVEEMGGGFSRGDEACYVHMLVFTWFQMPLSACIAYRTDSCIPTNADETPKILKQNVRPHSHGLP